MRYPSAVPRQPAPEDIEVGITVIGAVRVRCLLDPDWGSVLCLRVAPGELAQYIGVVTGVETGTPNLHLTSEHGWRFPTPEQRESLRQTVIDLYRIWKRDNQSQIAPS